MHGLFWSVIRAATWLPLAALAATATAADIDSMSLSSGDLYLPASLVRVVDGDTVEVKLDSGRITVRLQGIDTPEKKQRFGKAATKKLRSLLEGQDLEIVPIEQSDGYGRMIAKVFVDDEDIDAAMVETGYAWAYRKYLSHSESDQQYCVLEASARSLRRGVWSDPPADWQPPWTYRALKNRKPATFRDYSGETAEGCIAAIGRRDGGPAVQEKRGLVGTSPTIGCRIKGNINGKGERIYHVPGSPSYGGTRITESQGEKWFCNEGEAREAGWRAPR